MKPLKNWDNKTWLSSEKYINSFNKYILKLSIPIFFANLAVPLVGIIDTALMGNLGNLSYLSATAVADR